MENPWRVIEAAQRDARAQDAAVVRIIDTMLELQLDYRHQNAGYQPFSPTALMGEMPGGGGRSDQAMLAAMRYHPESQWHKACAVLLDQLPKRRPPRCCYRLPACVRRKWAQPMDGDRAANGGAAGGVVALPRAS